MTTVLDPPKVEEVLTDGILLYDISWATYESLLRDLPDVASPRFTYDRGDLLIKRNSSIHEQLNRNLDFLVALLAEEFEVESRGFGSTTYKRKDLQRGFEPDSCFYFKHEARMRGRKRINLPKDPPPDLVFDIDISSPTIKKLPLFAAFGILEIWRFDWQELEIHLLHNGQYCKSPSSSVLPKVTAEALHGFACDSLTSGRLKWIKRVRAWAQQIKASC